MLSSRGALAMNLDTCRKCIGSMPKSGEVQACPLDGRPTVEKITTGEGCGKGLLHKAMEVIQVGTPAPAKPPCCGKIVRGAIGLAKVAAQAVGIPVDVAGRDVESERLKICTACAPGAAICPACDCIIAAKVKLASEKCPLGKW